MILQISAWKAKVSPNPANDTRNIGYLLHKNPNSFLDVDMKFGTAHIFYTDKSEDITTLNLILDIDSLELSKGDYGYAGKGLFEYVNDGAFATNSFMAATIKKVFGTAIAGNCKERPDLLEHIPADYITITLFGIKASRQWAIKFFEPLFDDKTNYRISMPYQYGYFTVEQSSEFVDDQFEEFGQNPYINISIDYNMVDGLGGYNLSTILKQVYIFIMTCVYKGHSYMTKEEFPKLRNYTEGWWFDKHPRRNEILRRYFSGVQNYYRDYLNEYYPLKVEDMIKEDPEDDTTKEKEMNLTEHRRLYLANQIKSALYKFGVKEMRTLTEVGCGEGKQLAFLRASHDINIEKYIGLELDPEVVADAKYRLRHFDNVEILEGSILYKDKRLEGTDIMIVPEVIEHIDKDKLDLFCENVFNIIKPKVFIMTTPNREYNKYYNIPEGKLRHHDHRFEFNVKEYVEFVSSICKKYNYHFSLDSDGNMSIFDKIGDKTHLEFPTFGTVLYREDLD